MAILSTGDGKSLCYQYPAMKQTKEKMGKSILDREGEDGKDGRPYPALRNGTIVIRK